MARENMQLKLNRIVACQLRLCELFGTLVDAIGVELPQVKAELDAAQELIFSVVPGDKQQDLALCYMGITGAAQEQPPEQPKQEQSVPVQS